MKPRKSKRVGQLKAMKTEVDSYVRAISEVAAPPGFLDPYTNPEACFNLKLFMSRPQTTRTLLLVGEAP